MSCYRIIVMHLTRHSGIPMSAGWKPVRQLMLLCLPIIAIAAQVGANWKLSPVWSSRNHVHYKKSCYRIIVIHLTRHSGIFQSAGQKAVDQLNLLCLSIIAIAAQDGANRKLSPVCSPRIHIHNKMSCYWIIVMPLTRHLGIPKAAG